MTDEKSVVTNGIVLSDETLEIKVGEVATVQLALTPADAEKGGEFSVAHDDYVEVTIGETTEEGQDVAVSVKGLIPATTVVEVQYQDGETVLSAEILINVNEAEAAGAEEESKPADESGEEAAPPVVEESEAADEGIKADEEEPAAETTAEPSLEQEAPEPAAEPAQDQPASEEATTIEPAEPTETATEEQAPPATDAHGPEPEAEQASAEEPPVDGGEQAAEPEVPAEEAAPEQVQAAPAIVAESISIEGGEELKGEFVDLTMGTEVTLRVTVQPEGANSGIIFGFSSQFPFAKGELVEEDGGNLIHLTPLSGGQVDLTINSLSNPLLEKVLKLRISQPTTQAQVQTQAEREEHTKKVVSMIIAQELQTYADKMAPNVPHSDEEGARAQVTLFRAFQKVLRIEGADFASEMDKLLEFIHSHRKTLFSEYNAFRHMDIVALSPNDRLSFSRLLNAFITLADPSTRQFTVKQVDLNKTMELFGDQQAHQRVMQYFGQVN